MCAIEDIVVGDVVLAVDELGNIIPRSVSTLFKHLNAKTLDLVTDMATIRTTAEHPMWMGGDIYRDAGLLKVGDIIKRYVDGVISDATVIQLQRDKTIETVYNFEVEITHTYIANNFVVHNKVTPVGTSPTPAPAPTPTPTPTPASPTPTPTPTPTPASPTPTPTPTPAPTMPVPTPVSTSAT